MIRKLTISTFCVMFSLVFLIGQQEEVPVTEAEQIEQDYKDAWNSPYISDDMTVDSEQNKSWRMGEYKFSAKPKNCWELGFHFGHFLIDGDVDRKVPGGYGVGLHLRKAVNYVLSLRGSVFYGKAKGFESQPYRHKNNIQNGVGGGLVERPTFNAYDPNLGGPGHWFPSYKTMYVSADIAAVLNIGNLLFHKERNKWNWYLAVGVGLDHHTANLDLLDSNGLPYASLQERVNWTRDEWNTQTGRKRFYEELNAIYDGVYETEGFKKAGIFRIGDDFNVHFVFTPSMGISRKISKRLNIGIEHKVFLTDNDYLDGIKYRTALDQTNNLDVGHYTHVRIGLNLGNFSKVTEPLYWMNPIDAAFNDIANNKNRSNIDLADEDYDGVIDILDQELNTKEDCPVDTRGVILDSDGDGIVDCEDQEPYSRPGFPIDEKGIAQWEQGCCADEEDIKKLIDERTEDIRNSFIANDNFSTSDPAEIDKMTEDSSEDLVESIITNPAYKSFTEDDINRLIDARLKENSNAFISGSTISPVAKEELNKIIDTRINEIKTTVSTDPNYTTASPDEVNKLVDLRIEEIKQTINDNPNTNSLSDADIYRMIDSRIASMSKESDVVTDGGTRGGMDPSTGNTTSGNTTGGESSGGRSNEEINNLIDARIERIRAKLAANSSGGTMLTTACGNWFLPMIHYDLNKSVIKPEYYSHLHNVAQVMSKCPEICVVAIGHTDTRYNNSYNRVLSYKRAKEAVDYLVNHYNIDRNRLILMYGGEESPLVTSPSSEAHHFMNRRVEFRTCEVNDFNMDAPENYNPEAKKSNGTGGYYKGNKSSGY